jgi:competence protein ComFC
MSKPLTPTLSTLWIHNQVCSHCLSALKVDFYKRQIEGVPILSIYAYNEQFKEALYRFKAKGDIELAGVFIDNYKNYLRLKYQGYYLVPIPSSKQRDKERGFNHVEEVFKRLGLPLIYCIKKKVEFKQSDLDYEARQHVIDKLEVIDGQQISGKRILLVDDLVTTGATIKAALKLVSQYLPRSVQCLTLAYVKEKV